MGHHHDHGHAHKSVKNIRTAFFLNLAFTIAEIIGGIWTNSVAIVADAVHDLGDSLSLGFSWYLESKARQKRDNKFSFGYQRFSLLGALINGLVLLVGSFFVLSETVPRLLSPEPTHAQGMLYFALLGVAVNGAAVLKLKGGRTQNEKMLTWHLMEDVLGWVAVLIVSIVLLFTDWYILDPILSILILAFILYNVARNLKQTMMVFLQGVPEEVDLEAIKSDIEAIPQVHSLHQSYLWSLDGEKHVLSVHVVAEPVESVLALMQIKQQVREVLRKFPIHDATIEIEFEGEHEVRG